MDRPGYARSGWEPQARSGTAWHGTDGQRNAGKARHGEAGMGPERHRIAGVARHGTDWKGNATQAFNSVDPLIDNGNVEPKSTRGNTHG